MHSREKMGGKKRLSCKTIAKPFNDELELSRSSKYIANGRNLLDKNHWQWNDYHLRLYLSAENFEAVVQTCARQHPHVSLLSCAMPERSVQRLRSLLAHEAWALGTAC